MTTFFTTLALLILVAFVLIVIKDVLEDRPVKADSGVRPIGIFEYSRIKPKGK